MVFGEQEIRWADWVTAWGGGEARRVMKGASILPAEYLTATPMPPMPGTLSIRYLPVTVHGPGRGEKSPGRERLPYRQPRRV